MLTSFSGSNRGSTFSGASHREFAVGPSTSGLRLFVAILFAAAALLSNPQTGRSADNDQLGELVKSAGLVYWKKWWLKPAPDFTYADVRTGAKLSLRKNFEGKVVLINLWATWCPPCRREMPSLQALYEEFKNQGLVVLGVNVRETWGGVKSKEFAEQWGLTFPIVEADFWGPPFYEVSPIPHTYLVDQKGRLIGKRAGEWDWTASSVKALIKFLLAAE